MKELNKELTSALEQSNLSKDSLTEQYNLLDQRYNALLLEYEDIKAEREKALSESEGLRIRIRQLINQGSPAALAEAKNLNKKYEEEISSLTQELENTRMAKQQADQRAKDQEAIADQLADDNQKKEQEVAKLEDKIKDAKFQIDELKVTPLRDKRGKLEATTKANKIQQIEITFVVVESNLVEEGEKEIQLRLLGTNGEVLGAKNTTLVSSDQLVTMKQSFMYDGTSKKLKFNFKQESDYKKGGYTAELWYDGERLVRTQFNLD